MWHKVPPCIPTANLNATFNNIKEYSTTRTDNIVRLCSGILTVSFRANTGVIAMFALCFCNVQLNCGCGCKVEMWLNNDATYNWCFIFRLKLMICLSVGMIIIV